MTDRPSLEQLLDAVRMHLETLVIPAIRAEPKLYFQTLVAVNVLKIAQREVAEGQTLSDTEWESLNVLTDEHIPQPVERGVAVEALIARNRTLSADIRAGKYDTPEALTRLAHHVESVVSGQLMLNAPHLAQRFRIEDDSGEYPI